MEHTHTSAYTHLYYCICGGPSQCNLTLDDFPLLLIPDMTFGSHKHRKSRTGTHSNAPPPPSAPLLHPKLCTLSFGTIINKSRGEQKTAEIYYKGTVWLYGCGGWGGGALQHQCNSKCHADPGQACHIHLSDPYGWSDQRRHVRV